MQKAYSTLAKVIDQSEAIKRQLSLLLRTCSEEKHLINGQLCHEETIRAGQDGDLYLSSLILDVYGKCGAVYDAKYCFSMMEERSIFSWNCFISAVARHSCSAEALQCFEQIHQECLIPNSATFANVVAACDSREFLNQGKWLHARSQHTDLESYVVVQTAFIRMYHKCGKHNNAQAVFEATSDRDIVSWNAMLFAFVLQRDNRSAFQLFSQMQMECVMQDKYTYGTMFSACCNEEALKAGKQLHSCVLNCGFQINNVIMIALINMYWKCGSRSNARAVFHASPKQDLVTWSTIFTALSTSEDSEGEVIQLFNRLLEEALLPDKVIFLGVLAECSSQGIAWQGRQLHARLFATNVNADLQMATALLHMYGKLGLPLDANIVFRSMFEYDTVSWNAMITVLSQHSFVSLAFQNFEQMQQEAFLPDKITFTSVLSSFIDHASLSLGKHLHSVVVSSGLIKDVFIGNALVNMYCKFGAVDIAHEIFNSMNVKDIISWNILIAGYAQIGNISAAWCLLSQMCVREITPDQVTYCTLLSMMASDALSVVILKGVNTASFVTTDRNLGGTTRGVLENKKNDYMHNIEVLKSLTVDPKNAYVTGEFPLLPKREGAHTICCDTSNQILNEGMMLHCHILFNGLDKCDLVQNALLRFYGKCGDLKDCQCMFKRTSKVDVITWNLMISACIIQGHDKEAIQVFEHMQRAGIVLDSVSFLNVIDACANAASFHQGKRLHIKAVYYGFDLDTAVGTAFLTLYAKCGMLAGARWFFDHLLERDVVAWTSMISTYVQFGDSEEALELFKGMQSQGIKPDVVSFTSALNASELQSALYEGTIIHMCITQYQLESDFDVLIALIYMYGKCGSLFDADCIFSQIAEPNLPLWNALIASYAQQGDGRKVFSLLFSMMQQCLNPNNVTLIYILCAFSRAGLVEEALMSCFCAIGFVLTVEHCNCLLDLLGRVGQLNEAENLLKLMPLAPTAFSWASFLATCSRGDPKRAEVAMRHLIEINPVDSATYVTLSNIYAAAEESQDVEEFFQQHCSIEAGCIMSFSIREQSMREILA